MIWQKMASPVWRTLWSGANLLLAIGLVWTLAKVWMQYGLSSPSLTGSEVYDPAKDSNAHSVQVKSLLSSGNSLSANEMQSQAPAPILLQGTIFGELPATNPPDSATKNASDSGSKMTSDQEENARATKLNWILKGLIQSPNKNIALIQVGNQIQVVAQGEDITAQVSLSKVGEDYVILLNRGIAERLDLPGVERKTNATPSTGPATTELSAAQKAKLEDVRKQIQRSPLTITRYIRVRTLQNNGQITGLQLWPRREKEIFEALGFKAGDRLKAINGQPIAELAQNQAQWMTLMASNQVQMTIERSGVLQTLDINLNE